MTEDNNLFLISLGDLVDYGDDSDYIIIEIDNMIKNNKAFMVKGNHERKLEKYFTQKEEGTIKIQIVPCIEKSIQSFENNPTATNIFRNMVKELPNIIKIGNNIFVHGAIHPSFWDIYNIKSIIAYSFFGQVNKENKKDVYGFAIRLHEWVKKIPKNIKVFVGHDPISFIKPVVKGKAYYMDTGCSKRNIVDGNKGYLSGAIITGNKIKFIKFNNE